MNGLKLVIDIASVSFTLFVTAYFFSIFSKNKKPDKKKLILLSIVYFISVYCANNMPALKPYVSLLGYAFSYLLAFAYSKKPLSNLLGSTIITTILGGSEIVVGLVMVWSFKSTVAEMQQNMMLYLFALIFSKLTVYILVKMLSLNSRFAGSKLSIKTLLPLISLTITTATLISFIGIMAYNITEVKQIISTVLLMLLFIFSNIAVLYLIEKQTQIEIENQRLSFIESKFDDQLKHYKELYTAQKNTDKIWHDINKQLMGISGLLQKGQSDQAVEYISRLVGDFNKTINVVNTGFPVIDPIIRINQDKAKSDGIDFTYKVKLRGEITVDKMDVAIIVGNTLDNAIEACQSFTGSEKYIKLNIYNTAKDLFITVENPTNNVISDTENIISTKHTKTKSGFGINSIRSIASRNNGDVNIVCNEQSFFISVTLEL